MTARPWMFGLVPLLAAALAGCTSPDPDARLPLNFRNSSPDAFVEQPVPTADAPMPVPAAIDVALRNNPQIQLLKQAAEVAKAAARTCADLKDPEVVLDYGQGDEETDRSWLVPNSAVSASSSGASTAPLPPGGEQYNLTRSPNTFHGTTAETESYQVSIRFYPPNPWQINARSSGARAAYAAAVADVHCAEWQVRSQLKALFARIGYMKDELVLIGQLAEVRAASAGQAQALLDKNQASVADAMAASQRYIQTLNDRDKLERDLAAAKAELALLSGQTVGDVDVAVGDVVCTNINVSALSAEALQEQALQNRCEVAAAYWRSQAAMAALKEAKAGRIPWFTRLQGSYGQSTRSANEDVAWQMAGSPPVMDAGDSISIDDEEQDEWRVEAIVSIPLFSAGPGATRVQQASCKQAVAALGEATRVAVAQVHDALNALKETEARTDRLGAEIAPRMEEARALLNDLQQSPNVVPGTLEKIKEVSIETERMLLKSGYDRLAALIQLEQAVGSDLAALQ